MAKSQSADLTDSQKAHLGRILYRLESLGFELRADLWADSGQTDTIDAARQHLHQACEHLKQVLAPTTLTDPPLTPAQFLTTPLRQNPDVNTWMYNRLWRLSKELSRSNHPDFTAQELLDNGLTISRFHRIDGVGITKLAQLKAIFQKYGITIPLG